MQQSRLPRTVSVSFKGRAYPRLNQVGCKPLKPACPAYQSYPRFAVLEQREHLANSGGAANAETRLVVLIDRSEPDLVVQVFRAGATGVFSRSESQFGLLCKCVLCVHRGQIWANTGQLKSLVDALTQMPFVRVVDSDGANLLTKREEDLVRLVADGLSNRDIARKLNLSEHTVKNYVFRIFDKVGVSNRVELVLYALSNSRRAEASTSSNHAPKLVAAHGRESRSTPP
jgi:DNA-binding NarL/FixJ family response regulator